MSRIIHDSNHNPINLVTNYHWRPVIRWHELTNNERAEFEYYVDTPERQDEFEGVKYRGGIYDITEFEVAPAYLKRHGFDGVQTQSAFDAIALMYFDEYGNYNDEIIVAHIHW